VIKIPFGILGGGFAGIMAGSELKKRGLEFVILEQESEMGGLARTTKFEDIPGEFGPHLLYSRNEEVMDYFRSLPIEYLKLNRNARICHHGFNGKVYEVGYPFENGLGDLPPEERAECLLGYIECYSNKRRGFKSLEDWINNGLGAGIAKYFMIPYSTKIWNTKLSNISLRSIMKKIDPAQIEEVVNACVGLKTIGRAHQSVFLYPKKGTGSVLEAITKNFSESIHCNQQVKAIQFTTEGTVVKTNTETYLFQNVISTIPIPDMLRKQSITKLKPLAKKFHFNNTFFILVELKKGKQFKKFKDCQWVFFDGPEIFYRANMISTYVPGVPVSLIAEITEKRDLKNKTPEELCQQVIKDLVGNGLIGTESDLKTAVCKYHPYTYPIPTNGLDSIKEKIQKRLAAHNLFLFGRNGNWDYFNMDQIVLSCWQLFEKLDSLDITKSKS
jgi:protoporphyrinogen oxidase